MSGPDLDQASSNLFPRPREGRGRGGVPLRLLKQVALTVVGESERGEDAWVPKVARPSVLEEDGGKGASP